MEETYLNEFLHYRSVKSREQTSRHRQSQSVSKISHKKAAIIQFPLDTSKRSLAHLDRELRREV